MIPKVRVYRHRFNKIEVHLSYDVSNDILTSQIRREKSVHSRLITEWTIEKKNGGSDGILVLTLDDSTTSEIVDNVGYMDIMRFSGGEPLNVFEAPIEVSFTDVVTI